jgi:tRNA-dihydrouridine synthase
MAGITDWPFRLLCVEQGAGLVYTEMVNARALHHQDPETLRIAQPMNGSGHARCRFLDTNRT